MCGICGVWGAKVPEVVDRMITAMVHRGPDDRGCFSDDRVTLGMARLSIIDLSQSAHQPMSNPQKTIWIVYNGEVYNFQNEREHLEKLGHTFISHSDTEVVLRLYEHYGDDFLKRLRGMFALAIYDRRRGPGKERFLLARDQVGIKPLLYTWRENRLIFASEIKSIIASGMFEPQIDPDALRLLLTHGSVYQPHTILQGVKMLLPAHRLIVEGGNEHIECYWRMGLDRFEDVRLSSYEEQVDRVSSMLDESVKLQMVSDVPLGAFLSGGVDSSLLVGLMAHSAGKRLKTFSVGYGEEGTNIDETDDAQFTADFLGTDHTRVQINGQDVRQRIEQIAVSLDQPTVDGVNSYFVSLAARQAVTVAISGTGGDEIFSGYPWFIQMAIYENQSKNQSWKDKTRRWMGKILESPLFDQLILGRYGNTLQTMREDSGFLSRYGTTYRAYGSLWTAQLLSPSLLQTSNAGRSASYDISSNDELSQSPAIERVSALCLRGYTKNQLLRDIDAASMGHSLEIRVPFLDVPLIDLSLSLPISSKVGNVNARMDPYLITYRQSGSKKILVDVGQKLGVLRPNIADQPKRGFGMPFDIWLRGPLLDVLEDTLSDRVTIQRGLFRSNEVTRIKKEFVAGHMGWIYPWILMMTELWQRHVLDVKA